MEFSTKERIDALWNPYVRQKIELNEETYVYFIGKPIQQFIEHVAKDGYTIVQILKVNGVNQPTDILLLPHRDRINVTVKDGNLEMIEGIY
jgi:hypothetical protein